MKKKTKGRKAKKPCSNCGFKSTTTFLNVNHKKKVAYCIHFCDNCAPKEESNFYKI